MRKKQIYKNTKYIWWQPNLLGWLELSMPLSWQDPGSAYTYLQQCNPYQMELSRVSSFKSLKRPTSSQVYPKVCASFFSKMQRTCILCVPQYVVTHFLFKNCCICPSSWHRLLSTPTAVSVPVAMAALITVFVVSVMPATTLSEERWNQSSS